MSIVNEPNPDPRCPLLATPPRVPLRRRRWWRWPLRVFLILLVGATLLVWSYGHRHREAVAAVREAVAELDRTDPGWRLQDIEAARTVIPDAENSAQVVGAAYPLTPRDWPPRELSERCREIPPQVRLDDDTNEWLHDELCQTQDALLEARKLWAFPNGRYPITYKRNIFQTLLPHLDYSHSLFGLLQLDVVAKTEDRDLKGALRSCRALLNAGRSVGDEPLIVTQLVRIAAVALACKAVERILAQGEPDPDDLYELQKLFEEEERFPRLVVAMRGERAVSHEMLDAFECGELSLADVADTRGASSSRSWSDALRGFAERDYVRAAHPRALAALTEMGRIAALPPPERGGPIRSLDANLLSQRNIVLKLFLPAFGKINEAAVRTDGSLRCLIAALAAERYRQRHGRFPDTLEQLVPDFLLAVPLDPKDGRPLGYQHLPDRVVIYSLCLGGNNRTTYNPDEPSPPGEGVAFHLFDVKHRRQAFAELLPPPAMDDDPQPRGIDP
jgi:hypothetical protein